MPPGRDEVLMFRAAGATAMLSGLRGGGVGAVGDLDGKAGSAGGRRACRRWSRWPLATSPAGNDRRR